jgi:HSP20 family protein
LATTRRVNFALLFRHRSSPARHRRPSGGSLVRETRTGEFRRQFTLPAHVTAEHVEADYDRGLLCIRVRNVARPDAEPRKIAIRTERPALSEATE